MFHGRTDEKVATALGVGKDTYRKAREVVETVNDDSLPEPVREVAAAAGAPRIKVMAERKAGRCWRGWT